MSVETWITEYYEDVTGAKTWTDLKCFNHTRTKYIGTRKENLERHEVVKDGNMVFIPDEIAAGALIEFPFTASTCSLCLKYNNSDSFCKRCPMMIHEGFDCGDIGSAYRSFVDDNDSEPMIALMDELIARCDDNGNYAVPDDIFLSGSLLEIKRWFRFPWHLRFWKPCPDDRIKELAKAGALIAAEIDRLQRIRKRRM